MQRSACLICFATLLIAGDGVAANRLGTALDNDAALSTAAVVSVIRGAGAIWYNPAGLGGATRDKLDLALSAYMLRDRSADSAVRARLGMSSAAASDVDNVEVMSVPTSLAYARRLSDTMSIGVGLFVPAMDTFQSSTLTPIVDGPVDYLQRIELTSIFQRYHAGTAVGWQMSPTLRFGVGVFGVYETETNSGQVWSALTIDPEFSTPIEITLLIDAATSIRRIGSELTAGLQWTPVPDLHVGLTVRGPIVRMWSDVRGSALFQLARTGQPPVTRFDGDLLDDEKLGLIEPAVVHGGVAWDVAGGRLMLAADYRPGLDEAGGRDAVDDALNVQLGAWFPVSDGVTLGGGLFSDASVRRSAGELGENHVDFYGITGGVRLRDPLALAGEGADDIVFETTIGLRYAIGVGQAGGMTIDFVGDDLLLETPVDAVHHTATLHLGSALLF